MIADAAFSLSLFPSTSSFDLVSLDPHIVYCILYTCQTLFCHDLVHLLAALMKKLCQIDWWLIVESSSHRKYHQLLIVVNSKR